MTVTELGRQLRSRQISCAELIEQTLADIRKRDTFHSLITVTGEAALADARERDRELAAGQDRGPFHGIPIAYKDLFYTKGVRTTGGSLLFKDFIPSRDAEVVKRLHTAGAISIGKSNLHEIAFGITSKNPHYGFVLNPRDPKRIPGGSSGGSAALIAANFLPMALGSDTGGSIRIPASYCGITGLKPTYGRVSRDGVLPLAYSLDHVGPLGTSIEDCALAMNAMAGPGVEFNLPARAELKGIRVGVPKNFFFDRIQEEVAAAVRKSIAEMERLGAAILEIEIPDLAEANAAARIVQLSETASVYAGYTDPKMFGADVWALLEQGRMILGHEYVHAQRVRTLFRREFDALWRKIDILAAPTTPITAPLLDQDTVKIGAIEENARIASTRLVRSINFLGEPALSLPCGNDTSGMPIGLQLIGAPFSEPNLLQIAKTLMRA
ncbi:MAG TPA: amidase [Bryobacteraceae bacterium]|jgi:aspartyl-tRNA(Asn)/glutamyl-tRNA(Gln) amidotransferase subunit A